MKDLAVIVLSIIIFTILMAVLVTRADSSRSTPTVYTEHIASECHRGYVFAWSGSGYGGQRHIIQVMERTGDGRPTPMRCKEE